MAELTRYTGSALHQLHDWSHMSAEDRRRRAVVAANSREAEELWSLTRAYLFTRSKRGTKLSKHTLRAYRRGVLDLVAAWERENLLRPDPNAGVNFKAALEASGLQPSTINVKLAAARALYEALEWAGATEAKPFANVPAPHDPTPAWDKRAPYGTDEVERLLETAEGAEKLMVLLGAHAGLRISEMTELTWEDVRFHEHVLIVRHGKGGKSGKVRLTARLLEALTEYRGVNDKRYKGRKAKPYVLPWSTNHARERFRKLCERAGLGETYAEAGVHGLRHTAGTRYYQQVKDLGRVAAHLRHADVQTTRRYAKLTTDEIGQDIDNW